MTFAELQEIREKWQNLMSGSSTTLDIGLIQRALPAEWMSFIHDEMPKLFVEIHRLKIQVDNLTLDLQSLRSQSNKT